MNNISVAVPVPTNTTYRIKTANVIADLEIEILR
jgi:hypothetical protein